MSETNTKKAEWIPAHLNYDGPAKVEQYFDSRVVANEDGSYNGFFRGHLLYGKDLPLPEGYKSYLVSTENKQIRKEAELNPIRIWDLDTPSLEASMKFTDVVKIGQLLSED